MVEGLTHRQVGKKKHKDVIKHNPNSATYVCVHDFFYLYKIVEIVTETNLRKFLIQGWGWLITRNNGVAFW